MVYNKISHFGTAVQFSYLGGERVGVHFMASNDV